MFITPEHIKTLLVQNDRAVERAIVVLYERQTADEQYSHATLHSNKRGFSAFDAKMGSYYAKWIKSGRYLTGSHLEKARKMSMRYSHQLAEIAIGKARGYAA